MFDLTVVSRKAQSAVCMFLSALIVTTSLSLGAIAADYAANDTYSVTITQLA